MAAPTTPNIQIEQLAVDDSTLLALLQQHPASVVSKMTGLSKDQIYRRKKKPGFQALVADITDTVRIKCASRAGPDLDVALDTLVGICQQGYEDHAKVQAARALLDFHRIERAAVDNASAEPEDRGELLKQIMRATASAEKVAAAAQKKAMAS